MDRIRSTVFGILGEAIQSSTTVALQSEKGGGVRATNRMLMCRA